MNIHLLIPSPDGGDAACGHESADDLTTDERASVTCSGCLSYSPRHRATRLPSNDVDVCAWCPGEVPATHLITQRAPFPADPACLLHAHRWVMPGERIVVIGRHAARTLSTVHATPTR